MNLTEYTCEALVEMLEMAILDKKYEKYIVNIREEIHRRFGCYKVNVEHFSPYGVISKMTKTTEDFLKEIA